MLMSATGQKGEWEERADRVRSTSDSGRSRCSAEVGREQKGVLSDADLETLTNGDWKRGWDSTVSQTFKNNKLNQ